jgi:hypothetical protein
MRLSLCITILLASTTCAGEIPVVPLINIDPKQVAESDRLFAGYLPTTDESWGWAFAVQQGFRASITHVAWYDTNGDGLSHPHSIGIWRDTVRHELGFGDFGNLFFPQVSETEFVAEMTIPGGTEAELLGPWRRWAINPIVLGPGQYQLVGQNNHDSSDDLVFWIQPALVNASPPGITLQGLSSGQQDFGPIRWGGWLPSDVGGRPVHGGIMGPMLFVQMIIPEPSTALLSFIALYVCSITVGRRNMRRTH